MSGNGLNFNQAKYEIINKDTFIPYIRLNSKTSVPYPIFRNFIKKQSNDLVALLKITDRKSKKSIIRIKKLSKEGSSLGFSFKKERDFKDPKVEVLNILPIRKALKRRQLTRGNAISILSFLPTHIFTRSFPYQDSIKSSPIYTFELDDKIITGCYLGRKDIIFRKKLKSNEITSLAIGLYFAEGGKIQSSFTNSHPKMINAILDFIEDVSDIKREKVFASIYCHPKLKDKKKNLEEFWNSQTGVSNFSNKLHLSENSKSPCGTLELYFCSQILKEFMCGLLKFSFENSGIYNFENIIKGLFSGDSSPIQQTKTFLTHHITLDRGCWKTQYDFIEKFVSKFNVKIKLVPSNPKNIKNQVKAVIYSNWLDNMRLLFSDVYEFNLFNREKFARQFLSLRKTKLFLELESGSIVRGRDIIHEMRPVIRLRELGLVNLIRRSPKPNRSYEVYFTEEGLILKKKLQKFVGEIYPQIQKDINNFYRLLGKFELFGRDNKDESIL